MAAGEKGRFGKGYDPRRNYKGRPKLLSMLEMLHKIGQEPNKDDANLSNNEKLARWLWGRAFYGDWRAVEAILKRLAPERSTLELEQTSSEGNDDLVAILRQLIDAAEKGAAEDPPPGGDGPARLH